MRQKIKDAAKTAATAVVICALLGIAGCSDISVSVGPGALALMGVVSVVGLMVFVKTDC